MARKKILVADDDRALRKALCERLAGWGFDVVECADGLGVLSQAASSGADALILDHEMPNGDGQAVARILRKEIEVPIIFLSGHGREDFRSIVMQLSEVYYLHKPLEPSRLHDLLKACVPDVASPAGAVLE